MQKNKLNPVVIWTNIICILFMAALVAVLFLPAWEFKGEMISIADYIAFPTKKISLLRGFRDTLGLAKVPGVNDVVTVPVLTILFAVVSVVVTWIYKKLPFGSLVTLIAGVMALVTYLTVPFFPLAASHTFLVIAAAAATVAGLACFTTALLSMVKAEKKILAQE